MSHPWRPWLLCALLALWSPDPAGAADDATSPGPPTWYAQALTRGQAGLNVGHFWSKGAMLRTETVVAAHKIVTIVRGDWYYAYDALTGQGLAIRREPAAVARDRADRRPFGTELDSLLRQGAEKIREEELMGRRAGVYRVTDRVGRRELWVTLDEARIPLRLEIYDRRSAQRRYTDWINWQSDLHIPDGFFAPDPRFELEQLDYSDYLRRSGEEGTLGPIPVLYTNLLYVRKEE